MKIIIIKNLVVFIGILITSVIINCNSANKTNSEDSEFLDEMIPFFSMKPNDTINYHLNVNLISNLPEQYKYFFKCDFTLIGKGDSVLKSLDFYYTSFDWEWIQNDDTLLLSSIRMGKKLNNENLLYNVFHVDYNPLLNKTNWNEFYSKFADNIKAIRKYPEKEKEGAYQFINTAFNSNWICAKIRQIIIFRPDFMGYHTNLFKKNEKWGYHLPIEYEAISLHNVYNTCTIDSIMPDKIVARISGGMNGEPQLIDPNCISGNMVIDRNKKLLSYIKINQKMSCDEIPSMNEHDYAGRATNRLLYKNTHKKSTIRFDRIMELELILSE